MTDIVKRLSSRHWQYQGDATHWALRDEAADEIERLRAALGALLDMDVAYQRGPKVQDAVDAARAALDAGK